MQYRLKEARLAAGYTQEEAAWRAGITVSMLSRYERETNDPTLQRAIDLAELYHVSLDYLAGRTGYNK